MNVFHKRRVVSLEPFMAILFRSFGLLPHIKKTILLSNLVTMRVPDED